VQVRIAPTAVGATLGSSAVEEDGEVARRVVGGARNGSMPLVRVKTGTVKGAKCLREYRQSAA
jgi:hypothetical protein